MLTEVIIPIKNLSAAKQRLSGTLTPQQRSSLVLAMLEDLLGKLTQINKARIWVIASDQRVARLVKAFGAQYIDEGQSRGYNAAVTFALQQIAQSTQQPIFPAAVLPGDLPLAGIDELSALITPIVSDLPCISLAPDILHRGTNGLYLSRGDLIQTAFGNDSFRQHRHLAQRESISVNTINAPGLAHDIDTPDDLARLASVLRQGASYEFLQTIDLACLQINDYDKRGVA